MHGLVRRQRGALGAVAVAAAVVAITVALSSAGPTGSHHSILAAQSPAWPSSPVVGLPTRPMSIGLTELNANLLWKPGEKPGIPAAFTPGRALLSALHPNFVRLVVNWAALQPRANSPVRLDAPSDGCARGTAPCGAYAGLRSELAAIASQRGPAGGAQAVVVIAGAPAWAAHSPSGCERPGTSAFSRSIRPDALGGYRALIRALLALGRSLGVALPWWAPWNEPNHPAFMSPQRLVCRVSSPPLSPGIYSELEQAMAAELQADGGVHHLLLGELSGLTVSSPRTTSIAEFVADLPTEVLCASDLWSVHEYPGQRARLSPVGQLETALDARGSCGRRAHIWVTETGTGAARAGDPRTGGHAEQVAGCRQMAALLIGWYRDARVDAAFQYEFRDDTRFPVGLVTAGLDRAFPAYYLWLAWAGARASGGPPPLPTACT